MATYSWVVIDSDHNVASCGWTNMAYSECLRLYCKKAYGVTIKDWTFKTNIIAVETVGENRAGVFKIYPNQLKKGREEFYRLMKMVGICEMFGYSDDIEFLNEENRN